MTKHAHTSNGQHITTDETCILVETFWREPSKGFIGRAAFGIYDTKEEAQKEAIRCLKAQADHSKEILDRHLALLSFVESQN